MEETAAHVIDFVDIGCVSSFLEYQPKREEKEDELPEEELPSVLPFPENCRAEHNFVPSLFEVNKDCRQR